jgi:GTP cyclohydrolase II
MSIELVAETNINLSRKNFNLGKVKMQIYSDQQNRIEYIVIIKDEVAGCTNVLTRIHSECITGDLFGSDKCDCGQQLDYAYKLISEVGKGIIIYIKGHEGRGIGLVEKIKAYSLQETKNLDTIEANEALGHKVDLRNFDNVNLIINNLLIKSIALITNNPDKIKTIKNINMLVNTKPEISQNNLNYLKVKKEKLGHFIQI